MDLSSESGVRSRRTSKWLIAQQGQGPDAGG